MPIKTDISVAQLDGAAESLQVAVADEIEVAKLVGSLLGGLSITIILVMLAP